MYLQPIGQGGAEVLQQNMDLIQRFLNKFHVVTGTPEGQTVAPVGHLAMRVDGGASTTLYVKETGSGNTGWVAK